jgi:hypothetical protein
MNIFKYFVLILVIIAKNYCSPFNHLDLQLALLILSTGDYNGEILYDPTVSQDSSGEYSEYLTVNIGKNSVRKRSIVEILPVLNKIKNNQILTDEERTEKIKNKFRELYKKSIRIAYDRLGYDQNDNLLLTARYKQDRMELRERFNNKVNNLDIFRLLNNKQIGLINNDFRISTLSFYQTDENNNINNARRRSNISNNNFIKYIVGIYDWLDIRNNEGNLGKTEIVGYFEDVAKACREHTECSDMFNNIDINGNLDFGNIKYSLIKKDNNRNINEQEF